MDKRSNPESLMFLHRTPATTSDGRLPAHLGIGSIDRHQNAFVQLYYAVEARRTSAMPLVVQFISPSAGAGASTVACGYARVAADDCAGSVLYIDCNAPPPLSRMRRRRGQQLPPAMPTLADALHHGAPLAEAIVPARDAKNLAWARLSAGDRPLLELGGDRLQSMLDMLRVEHPVIVLDTPSTDSPESAAVSRYCDGSVLVIAAGKTRQWEIEAAKSLLERLGGQTVGVVLNRERKIGWSRAG